MDKTHRSGTNFDKFSSLTKPSLETHLILFQETSNDFKQKSTNLNDLCKSSGKGINIEPNHPRFAKDISIFRCSLNTLQLPVRIFIKLKNCVFRT